MTSPDTPQNEIREKVNQLEDEPRHTLHVSHLTLQLFDSLAPWHQLGPQARILLEAAASLHDIGWRTSPDGRKHHKESARLIRLQSWRHFNQPQVDLIAQIARYHRKSIPSLRHKEFAALAPDQQRLVRQLAAILRVADALDRSHLQCVQQVSALLEHDALTLQLQAHSPVRREMATAQQKGDLLQELLNRPIRCTTL